MAWRYSGKNTRPFSAVCGNKFGRKKIETQVAEITEQNIVDELQDALSVHRQNRNEIDYLQHYYEGDQPILYRKKRVRPEVNNKVVNNFAYMTVEMKTSEIAGEPIQYVLRGTDEDKSTEVAHINKILDGEDKQYYDIELCRDRSICGTAYRYIGQKEDTEDILDGESTFYISVEEPRNTFICYFDSSDVAAFSCQIRKDIDGKELYNVFTKNWWYLIKDNKIIDKRLNYFKSIPVIEYPNNKRRLSDIEITIEIFDELNTMASDRANGIEQFVSSWIKFVNCEIDIDTYRQMRQEGALVVKSNNGDSNKADVDVMTSELNQSQTQVAVDNQFNNFLMIQGLASRQGNTGGDTQGAVELRNGHYDAEKRAELSEPIFKRSEKKFLRNVLKRLKAVDKSLKVLPYDIEVKISRTKMDNMQVKALVLQTLLQSGIDYTTAIKVVGLFSDPEQVALDSKERMDILYPTTTEGENEVNNDRTSGDGNGTDPATKLSRLNNNVTEIR